MIRTRPWSGRGGLSRRASRADLKRGSPDVIDYLLDPNNPPKLSHDAAARFDAMTLAEIEAGAASDPENPPLSALELLHLAEVSKETS